MRIFIKFPLNYLLITLVLLTWQCLCLNHEYSPNELLTQIRRTRHLIQLYESKLQILVKMAQQQNVTQQQPLKHQNDDKNSEELSNKQQSSGENSQNNDKNQQKSAKEQENQFKLEQQIAYQSEMQGEFGVQSDYLGNKDVVWIQPHYVLDSIAHEIVDINTRSVKIRNVPTKVISVQSNQITLWNDQNTLRVISFKDQVISKQINMKVSNIPGKWHHATKFDDILMQHEVNTLILTSIKEQQKVQFKSKLIDVFSIHQYRILFVTTQSYGFMNPKSLELLSEHSVIASYYNNTDKQSLHQLQKFNTVTSAYYFHQAGIFFLLFENLTITIFEGDKIVGTLHNAVPESINTGASILMSYFGTGYLFVHNSQFCFHILQVTGNTLSGYTLSYYRQVCPPNMDPQSQSHSYQFFKHNNIHKILITPSPINKQSSTCRLYHLNLTQKQVQSQRSIPWKLIIIVLGVIAVVFYKSRKNKQNSNRSSRLEDIDQGNEISRKKGNNRKIGVNNNINKRDKNDKNDRTDKTNYQSDYLKQIAQQIKKNKVNIDKDQ